MPPRKRTTAHAPPSTAPVAEQTDSEREADEQAAVARQQPEPLPDPVAYPRTHAEAVEAQRCERLRAERSTGSVEGG